MNLRGSTFKFEGFFRENSDRTEFRPPEVLRFKVNSLHSETCSSLFGSFHQFSLVTVLEFRSFASLCRTRRAITEDFNRLFFVVLYQSIIDERIEVNVSLFKFVLAIDRNGVIYSLSSRGDFNWNETFKRTDRLSDS